MSGQKWWAKHYQDGWLERAHNVELDLWLRVAFLAYGKHRRNGHAPFASGGISSQLQVVSRKTGEVCDAKKQAVNRAINTAVSRGFLSPQSGARCLVVPPHHIEGGSYGWEFATCDRHGNLRLGAHE